ncbi:MAG TPA: papain-like cysteine protease family protein [Bradyrhizobium sp.]|nr:papain-like cysteine protease family protein [Bradyrhizobium sp.]
MANFGLLNWHSPIYIHAFARDYYANFPLIGAIAMSISRRSVLAAGVTAAATTLLHRPSSAEYKCNAAQCDARIPTKTFRHIQQEPNSVLCWAATIAMICGWHGRAVHHHNIVRQTFGGIVNAPADPITLINSVNRLYVDDQGKQFSLSSRVWSVLHGIANLDNAGIIQELSANRPLVVCNMSHMMVLVGVSAPAGTMNINQGWVADPAVNGVVTAGIPGLEALAPGFRYLFPAELTPAPMGGQLAFVAAVNVA